MFLISAQLSAAKDKYEDHFAIIRTDPAHGS